VLLISGIALLALSAPAAQAKGAKLDGQLVAAAATKGSKVTAPILLSDKTAKKLKLKSPLATLTTKKSQMLPAPNPAGEGTVQIAAGTLRAGDAMAGKVKTSGSKKALVPKLKGSKLQVTSRESRYSVDELTDALTALYAQVGALGLRVTNLELNVAQIRQELEEVKEQNGSLEGQIEDLLAQLTDLEGVVADLEDLIGTLPTAQDLQDALDAIADLEDAVEAIEALLPGLATDADITALQNSLNALDGELDSLTTDVTALQDTVDILCALPIIGGACV
jgi:prefoldin subunit 5